MIISNKKHDKKSWIEYTSTIACPCCGRQHRISYFDCKWRLDGTPAIPMATFLNAFVVCQCGMLVSNMGFEPNIMNSESYKQILNDNRNELQKLKLIQIANGNDATMYIYTANYYHEQGDFDKEQEMLSAAIKAMESGAGNAWETIAPNSFLSIKTKTPIDIGRAEKMIDVYRRMKCWDLALSLIEKERNRLYQADASDIFVYLGKQEQLIKHKNSAPQ